MSVRPANMLFIMSDEHSKRVMGLNGNRYIKTPNLDRLAARGVSFSDAYCNCPICVPSRASFQTGRYVHDIGFWDNAIPYDGSVPAWAHRLRETGHRVDSIGKLHFRSADDDNGFSQEHMPLHVVEGIGDPIGLLRDPPPRRKSALQMAAESGCGDSTYQGYDDRITAASEQWLKQRASEANAKPWTLFVSLICPHFPLIARPEWYDLYRDVDLPWPLYYEAAERPNHPFIKAMRASQIYDEGFTDKEKVRRALTAYYGLVTFVDHNIGRLLDALDANSLTQSTRVIYTSDHGDNLGTRGLWGKSNMYEESVAVPLIMAGPDVPQGVVCREPVSLVDCFPTIIQSAGLAPHPDDSDQPGASLLDVVAGHVSHRTILSEYHAAGAATGAFMIRKGDFKYVYYVGMPPQLFDLGADPHEARDLAGDPGYAGLLAACKAELFDVVDPESVDARARRDQAARIKEVGGKEAILAKGSFGYSPVPGTKPIYN